MEITHTKDTRTSSSIKIIHPKDFPPLSTISCLIYGRRGVGKTTFALSAPNPILLNLGGRVTTTHQQDNIITISSYDRLLEVLKSGTLNNYDTIIIDTFDDLVTYVFDNLSEKDPKLKKDNGEPTITGWSAIKCNIQNFLNELFKLKLDKHLIFTAHVREYPHGVRPGSKILMLGSGNVGLVVSFQLMQCGCDVVALVDAAPRVGGYGVHASKIARTGVPFYLSHTIVKAEGEDHVTGVTIAEIDSSFKFINPT